MICVFDVIEGPARGKRFWLRENQRIAVGRISTADFSVPADPHMSRHHLIFEANLQVVRVRDVGSANGTFVNNSRINNLELCPGDRVRAGSTTFEISVLADNDDPHAKDGTLQALPTANRSVNWQQGSAPLPTQGSPQSASIPQPLASPAAGSARTGANQTGSPGPVDPASPDGTHHAIADPRFLNNESSEPESHGSNHSTGVSVSTRILHFDPSVPHHDPDSAPGDYVPREHAVGSGTVASAAQSSDMQPFVVSDEALTMRSEPQWWSPYFRLTGYDGLLEQYPGTRADFVEVLKRAQSKGALAFVVNLAQLNEAALQFYKTAIPGKLVLRLSRSLILVHCDDSDNVWNFVRKAARQDAIICLSAHRAFDAAWLVELLDYLSYPSMLSSLLFSGHEKAPRRLLKYIQFAIFEKNRNGELSALINVDSL